MIRRRHLVASARPLPSVTVVVTVHPAYYRFLPECLESINNGQLYWMTSKILAVDAAVPPKLLNDELLEGWKVVCHPCGHPNELRSVAWSMVESEWVIGWDSDNVMPPRYISELMKVAKDASANVAIVSPSVEFDGQHLRQPDTWVNDEQIRRPIIDTASAWRTYAARSVGFFRREIVGYHDDYDLAVRLMRQGWTGLTVPDTCFTRRMHGENRSNNDGSGDAWQTWSFCIVTLWGEESCIHGSVVDWIREEAMSNRLPPNTRLVWIDNRNARRDYSLLHHAMRLRHWIDDIRIIHDDEIVDTSGDYLKPDKHAHVARLYNRALSGFTDEMLVTLEDDMIPPAGGIRQLFEHFGPYKQTGVAASIYRARHSPAHICAAMSRTIWDGCPTLEEAAGNVLEAGFTGGGFTLWHGAAVRAALPLRIGVNPVTKSLMGWDGNLCQTVRSMGLNVIVDGRVESVHDNPEVNLFLRRNGN